MDSDQTQRSGSSELGLHCTHMSPKKDSSLKRVKCTEDHCYNDNIFYKRFCCKIEFAVKENLLWTSLKHE